MGREGAATTAVDDDGNEVELDGTTVLGRKRVVPVGVAFGLNCKPPVAPAGDVATTVPCIRKLVVAARRSRAI